MSMTSIVNLKWQNLLGSATLLCVLSVYANAAPWMPIDENEILETLPIQIRSSGRISHLRRQLDNEPENIENITSLAREYIEQGRAESDPRFFGYAKALLKPWASMQQPPVRILLLRATLKQHYHDYQGAKEDLFTLIKQHNDNAQAWLTLATIQLVQGDYQQAKKSCSALVRSAGSVISGICFSQLLSLSGSAQRAREILQVLQQRISPDEVLLQEWVLSIRAEINVQLGNFAQAELDFKKAIALPNRNPYLLRSYTELLLQQGRNVEVLQILKNESRDDALLLQLCRAAKYSANNSLLRHYQSMLDLRYEEAKLRDSSLHQREEAVYRLEVTQQYKQAHHLALANWRQQKEPYDTLILLQTAIAMKDYKTIFSLKQTLSESGLEDVKIHQLMDSVKGDLL